MNPLRVSAANYRTYEALDVQLPEGCTAIVGPNGSGKSSILNVIELALFGPQSRQLAPYLTTGAVDPLVVELDFEHRGEHYRVRRMYDPAGRGKTTLDFEQIDLEAAARAASPYTPLTASSQAETQAIIERTIGLSRNTFRASCFLAQSDGAAFTEALPADRKAILSDVLQLDLWVSLNEAARERRAEVVGQTGGAEGLREQLLLRTEGRVQLLNQIAELETAVEKRKGEVGVLEASIDRVHRHAVAVAELGSQVEKATGDLNSARLRMLQAETDLRHCDEAVQGRETAQKLLAEKEVDAAPLIMLEEQLEAEKQVHDDHRLAVAAWQANVQAWKTWRKTLDTLLADRDELAVRIDALRRAEQPTCELCSQPIGLQEQRRQIEVLIGRRNVTLGKISDHDGAKPDTNDTLEPPAAPSRDRLDEIVSALNVARNAEDTIRILEERIAGLTKLADSRDEQRAALDAFTDQVRHHTIIAAELKEQADELIAMEVPAEESVRLQLTRLRDELETDHKLLTSAQTRLEAMDAAADELQGVQQQLRTLATQKALLDLAVKAYGRDGVPAMLIESVAVPQIETEANRILAELGTDYSVELRTQRETKTGQIVDALDIVIATPAGERLYETYSYGERTRINLALRIGLARLLAHRSGSQIELLAIDEPEFLDDEGVEQLAAVLEGLASDFARIILISHMPALRDAFPQALIVSKHGERSEVAGTAATASPVPA